MVEKTEESRPLQSTGEVIRNMLAMRGWSQTTLASVLDKPLPHVNAVINGKRPVTAELAVGLASAFGTEADFWLTLEAQRQLASLGSNCIDEAVQRRARCYELAPIKEMQKRGWISEATTADELVSELQAFLHMDDLNDKPRFFAATRRSGHDHDAELTPHQCAWCYRAWQVASSLPVPAFDHGRMSQCKKKLRETAAHRPEIRNVAVTLAEFGIRFVIVEPLPGSLIDGAAFWLDASSPVIAMSLRFDRIDNFWFTLFHECSHIENKDSLSVDSDLSGTETSFPIEKSPTERRADNEAAASLVEPETMNSFIKRVGPMYSRKRIVQFAHRIKTHPGIIVGQLQHRGEIGFHAHKEFLVKVRDVVISTAVTDGWGQTISKTCLL